MMDTSAIITLGLTNIISGVFIGIGIAVGNCCELCGKKNKLEVHHPNYKDEVKVQILCRKCHRRLGGVHHH